MSAFQESKLIHANANAWWVGDFLCPCWCLQLVVQHVANLHVQRELLICPLRFWNFKLQLYDSCSVAWAQLKALSLNTKPPMLQILGEHESSVKKMLDEFGVYLKPSTFGKDVKPFLKDACSQIFGSATGLVDMMIAHVPSSKAGAANKVSSIAGVHDV